MNYDEILVPNHLYEMQRDIQPGYYLFSNLGIEDKEHLDVYFNMYPERPPVSRYHREEGYFGVAELTSKHKYIKIEYGRALYYGKPFNLYEVLNSVALPDNDYHPEGVVALENKLCTIRIFKQERSTYLYHGDGDAEVYEQYLYSINDHKFWAGVFAIKSYRSYNALAFGFLDAKEEQHYSFTQRCNFAGMCYSAKENYIRLHSDKRGEFIEVELPQNIDFRYAELEWIQPSSSHEIYTGRLFRTKKTIQELYASEIRQLTAFLYELQKLGLDLDIAQEQERFKNAPDFLASCIKVIGSALSKFQEYQAKVGDTELRFTFAVPITYNKQYYCAARLADTAERVKRDNDVYYVTFRGDQIQEIALMYANLITTYIPTGKSDWDDSVPDYLFQHDFHYYLARKIQEYLSRTQEKHGFYSAANNSVLVTICKALNTKRTQELNELYAAMLHENRVTARWNSEYSLFALISEYIPDAIYQYRVHWLGQQSFDIFLPFQNIAIEYQGQQHYEAIELFGGDAALDNNKERDARKRAIAIEHGIRVLDWKYDVPISRTNVLAFFETHGILHGDPVAEPCFEMMGSQNPMAPVKQRPEKAKAPKVPRPSKFVIRQYSVDGQFLEEYSSFTEASDKSQVSERAIRKVVYGERKTGGGFIWQRCHRDSEITNIAPVEYAENTGVAKKVLQLDEDGNLIAEYGSIGQAVKQTGVSSRGISDVLAGAQKTAGGYVWVYR